MSKNVKLKINAISGKIDLQCPEDFFETAMEQCINFVSSYPRSTNLQDNTAGEKQIEYSDKPSSTTSTSVGVQAPTVEQQVLKQKRTRGKSSKPRSYTRVDLKLTDEQARELRSFYTEKSPKTQNDILCVVAHKLKQLLKKDTFSRDEIFSGIQLLEGVKTPKDLKSVFRNTSLQGNGVVESGEFKANFATDDYVNFKLPQAKE